MVNSEKTPEELLKEAPALVLSVITDFDTQVMAPDKRILGMMSPSAAKRFPADSPVRILTQRAAYAPEIGKADAFLCMLKDIDAYAKDGELNLIASFYKENANTIKENRVLNSIFMGALRKALKVCANDGRLSSLSELIREGAPAPIAGKAMPAAFKAMRVCMGRNDPDSIAVFLETPNIGERICSKGICQLYGIRAFRQINRLLEKDCLPEGAKEKAKRACLKHERSQYGEGAFSRFFSRKQRPNAANPATPACILRIGKRR